MQVGVVSDPDWSHFQLKLKKFEYELFRYVFSEIFVNAPVAP